MTGYGGVVSTRLIGWSKTRVSSSPTPAILLHDLKAQSRLTDADTEEDDLIKQFGLAAEEAIELELNIALLTQHWELRLDAFPDGMIPLPRPPLASVESITYLDTDGVTQILSSSLYTVDINQNPGRIILGYGQSWPSTRSYPNAVVVAYTAGTPASADKIPALVKAAIRLTAADLYENRERSADVAVRELVMYERLVANYRCVYEFNYTRLNFPPYLRL